MECADAGAFVKRGMAKYQLEYIDSSNYLYSSFYAKATDSHIAMLR